MQTAKRKNQKLEERKKNKIKKTRTYINDIHCAIEILFSREKWRTEDL